MHESFRLEEGVPATPGESPFHVRGVYYASVIDDAKNVPGGLARFLNELADPRVREFMRQGFQFMTWYDACPTLPCGVALARIRERPYEAYMRETGQAYMRRLIPSMFRIFSRIGGPRLAAAHASRLFQMYFDCFQLSIPRVTDTDGTGHVTGLPLYLAPVFLNQSIGIISGALESLGAHDIEATYRDVVPSNPNDPLAPITCQVDFKWRLEGKPTNTRP